MGKNQKKNEPTLSRRQLLTMCGVAPFAFDPIRVLLNGIVDGIITNASAATAGIAPRSYVNFYLGNGPARWAFDLPLVPYEANSAIARNPMVNTRFADTGGANLGAAEYATFAVPDGGGGTINMPSLWGNDIPTSNGLTIPMSVLAQNMLIIRGVKMPSDGHPSNALLQLRPAPSAPSITGMVADASDKSLPAVSVSGGLNTAYKSGKGVGQVVWDGGLLPANQPLNGLLSPFFAGYDGLPNGFMSRRVAMESAMKLALGKLGDYAKSNMPGSESLYGMATKAEAQVRAGIGDVAAEYTRLYDKYNSLVARAFTMNLPGINSKPVPLSGITDPNNQCAVAEGRIVKSSDLRTLIQPSTSFPGLAEGLAIAEYLVVNGYSSSVSCGAGTISSLLYESYSLATSPTVNAGTLKEAYYQFDHHGTGSAVLLLVDALMYRAIAACLYELISVLKSKNLFNETVIHLMSEFSRSPRQAENGSDHGWEANCTSIFSGAITRGRVLGNVRQNYANTGYIGSWGAAGKVNVDGSNRELGIGHVSSTICKLLRVATPTPNDHSIVSEDGSPLIELAKTNG